MQTRRQNPDTKVFRQDAFASSVDYERGILGNLVAARCQTLSDANVIATLWWLQQVSWRDGGLTQFASDFLKGHSHLFGTPCMHDFNLKAGHIYNASQIAQIRREWHSGEPAAREMFPLKGERRRCDRRATATADFHGSAVLPDHPESYPVRDFLELCTLSADELIQQLRLFLLNPSTDPVKGLWNMPGLWSALCACRDREATGAASDIVEIDITRRVFEELDFALESRSFILVEGREGIGKSRAAENWCKRHPGRAVYIRLESGTDDTSFFRSIARAIGTACSYGLKTAEMRARIQDALQPGHLVLVIDEAHFAFPQGPRSHRTNPMRVEWLRTALVDFDVPVALISTPQYFATACSKFRKGGWNSLQVQRRLVRTKVLPEPHEVSISDVTKVVASHFPNIDVQTGMRIAALAIGTIGFLTTIKHVRKRVDFLMGRRPGAVESGLLEEVMREMGLPEPAKPAPSVVPSEPVNDRLTGHQRHVKGGVTCSSTSTNRLVHQPAPAAV